MVRSWRAAPRQLLVVFAFALLGVSTVASADPALQVRPPGPVAPPADQRVVVVPPALDRNRDRVDDRLEWAYRQERKAGLQTKDGPPAVDLMICLDYAPTGTDLERYRAMGATHLESWSDLVYAVRARFPATRVPPSALARLGSDPGVVWVEENAVSEKHVHVATRQVGARRTWAMGFEGSPEQSIAILDDGIDGTHPDLASRIIAWADFAGVSVLAPGDEYPTPGGKGSHGTAVAGLAAGDGTSAGIVTGAGPLNLSFATTFSTLGNSVSFPMDTTGASGASRITARLRWELSLPDLTQWLQIFGSPSSGMGLLGGGWFSSADPAPFTMTIPGLPSGLSAPDFKAKVGAGFDMETLPAWLQMSTPMSAVGDGRPLMRGVAPGCKLIGVRIFDDGGSTNTSTTLNAITWLSAHRRGLNLVCVNHSAGFKLHSALDDFLVNRLVENGVVWVNSGGNYRDDGLKAVFSPGSAAKAITVGAVDDRESVAFYSSFGSDNQRKPDLVAPGGSSRVRLLIGVDTNSVDDVGHKVDAGPDSFLDDYTEIGQGTSFAAPVVAGAVMLVAQALGPWTHTEDQVQLVKMLLLMTATETGRPAEEPPHPVLSRGEKDTSEGFGRMNVDAAVEAAASALSLGTTASVNLGPGLFERKAWARGLTLNAGTTYSFTLALPLGADYDLYLYSGTPVSFKDAAGLLISDGEPEIAAKSTRAALGGDETVRFTPSSTGRYYLVVKHVGGGGGAAKVIGAAVTSAAEADFVLAVSPTVQVLEVKGEEVSYTVTATALSGSSGPIRLSLADALPEGTTARFSPETVTPGGVSRLTIVTTAQTPRARLGLSIQGVAGGVIRTAGAFLDAEAIWPRFRRDARGTGRGDFSGPLTSREGWSQYLLGPIVASPAIDRDGTLYVANRRQGSFGGRLVAFRGADGKRQWSYDLPGGAGVESSPAIGVDGTVYFGADDGRVYALRPDGGEKWRLSLGTAPIRSGPVLAPDGTIYVTAGGNLYAVRPEGSLKWSFASGGTQNSSPTLAPDGTIYFGAGSGGADGLYAVRDTGGAGQQKWRFPTVGAVLSSPTVAASGRIYFGSDGSGANGRFYVLADDGTAGRAVAEVPTGGPIQSSPALAPDGSVYAGCHDNELYAFTAGGVLKWRYHTGGSVVGSPTVGADGTIYVGSRDQYLYALRDEGNSASQVWRAFVFQGVEGSPAIGTGGTLYVGSLLGKMTAYQDSGAAAAPSYSVIVSPSFMKGLVGDTSTHDVSVTARNGSGSTATFDAGRLPPGVTARFEPSTVNLNEGRAESKLILSTSSATPAGWLRFEVRLVAGGSVLASQAVTLALADFRLIAQPPVQRVTAGRSNAFAITSLANPGAENPDVDTFFGRTVGLTASIASGPGSGSPPVLSIDRSSIPIPGFATITAATSADTAPGIYIVEARGTSGPLSRTIRLPLHVAGFAVTATPAVVTVSQGAVATYAVNVRSLRGFNQPVSLVPTGALPAGVAMTFAPATISGDVTSTLAVSTSAATPIGTHWLAFTGTAGGVSLPMTVILVTAPP